MPRSTPAADGLVALAPSPARPRRNPRWIAAGLAAMCLGAVGSVALWTQAAESAQVVQLAHAVERGQRLDADDLVVVTVGRLPEGAAVSGTDLSGLIGREALSDLPSGTILAPGSVGELLELQGAVTVGLRLAPGRIPAQHLPVGTHVLLVALPAPGAGSEKLDATFQARVATASAPQPDGGTTLDVAVLPAEAAQIARLAATDQLSVVREAGR